MPARNTKTATNAVTRSDTVDLARSDEEAARELLGESSTKNEDDTKQPHACYEGPKSAKDSELGPDFDSRGVAHSAWQQAIDKLVNNADDIAALTSADMREVVSAAVGEEVLVTSASAIEDYFEQACARRRSNAAANAAGSESPARKAGSKLAPARGASEKEYPSPSHGTRRASPQGAAKASPQRASPSKREQQQQALRQGQQRQNWHDAIDRVLDGPSGDATTLVALLDSLRATIGAEELVANAAAIEQYFEVEQTRRRDLRAAEHGETRGGRELDLEASEGAQKRSRRGDAQDATELAGAPKAARMA